MTATIKHFVESEPFHHVIVAVIDLAGVVAGLETSQEQAKIESAPLDRVSTETGALARLDAAAAQFALLQAVIEHWGRTTANYSNRVR